MSPFLFSCFSIRYISVELRFQMAMPAGMSEMGMRRINGWYEEMGR